MEYLSRNLTSVSHTRSYYTCVKMCVHTGTQTEAIIGKERGINKKRRKECYYNSFATREDFDAKNTTQSNFYWASTPL